ncbi:unnamed protein product, partial [Prorocentrum cordatum]
GRAAAAWNGPAAPGPQVARAAEGGAAAGLADPSEPVVAVLGAGGKTGSLVVQALVDRGARVRALTRSGRLPGSASAAPAPGVELGRADVTDAASLAAGLAGATAAVFAAAWSRGGARPRDVDNRGLVKAALAARDAGVERLVVVSSIAVTRPYAPVGVLLNTVGSGVLLEKQAGESEMRGLLRGTGTTYTVVRPGGLRNTDASGFASLEFNQGDTLVGSVSRADVAAVCATAALDPENRGANKTFEMYEASSRNKLLPWFGDSPYTVDGRRSCEEMLDRLRQDEEVTDVPGFLPFS